ncbi:MAG TPA: single-stranded DNA-binding protein [Phycisphaerales bacterium]|nr:single-stranded DNA-binding protein [Phycisphaerales bacterium]
MPNYNKVLLMGNLTRDVELKYTPGNMAVANLGIAVNRRYKGNDGEMKEETTFVDCEAWAQTAENLSKWFSKGRPIFLEGRLKLDQWQDKDGGNRSKLKVVVENFQFVDSKSGAQGGAGGSTGGNAGGEYVETPQRRAAPAGAGASKSPANTYTGPTHEPLGEDDIPF